jgi:ubiquinone/menaquinone biosynthesis C-methylase UbiE
MMKINGMDNEHFLEEQVYSVRFVDPESIIQNIGVAKDSIIADFGCGGGYFSLPMARRVGENGVVYALDILPQSLEMVNGYAKTMGLTNIITKRVNLEKDKGSTLADGSCDWVVMKSMLFQNRDKETIIKEASRVLKKGGRALIIEWDNADLSIGPEIHLRISKEVMREMIQSSELSLVNEFSASNFHYGMVVVK